MPWLLVRANLGYFRRHPWLLTLVLVGMMLGVAVVAGVETTNHSARKNFALANQQLLGQGSHRISAEQPIPESLLRQLKTELGVTAAPLIRRYVRLVGSQPEEPGVLLQLLGVDPFQLHSFRPVERVQVSDSFQLQELLLTANSALVGAITAHRLQLPEQIDIVTHQGIKPLRLLGRIGDADDSRFSRLLLMDIGRAQQLLQMPGLLDELELSLSEAEVAQVQQWLPQGYQLQARSEQRQATANLSESLHLNLSALGLLALVVGLFLVYSTLTFSLLQRQQLFAQLRSLGITRRELAGYLLLELLLLGLLGAGLGLLLGLWLADYLLLLVTRTVNDLYFTSTIQLLQVDPLLLAKVLAVGLGGACLAGLVPAWRTARLSVRSSGSRQQLEQHSRGQSRRFFWQALVLLAVAGLFSQLSGSGVVGGYIAVTALLLACASLMPILVLLVCRWLRRLLSRPGATPELGLLLMATGDTERGLSRTGVALMALMVAISATVGMGTMIGSFRSTLEVWLGQRLNADIYVGLESRLPGDPRTLSPQWWQWLDQQPELRAVASYLRTETLVQGRRVELFANRLPPASRAGYRFKGVDSETAWRAYEQPDQLLISEPLAVRQGLDSGDYLLLPTPRGPRRFRIAGVYYDYGNDGGRLLISQLNFSRYWTLQPGRVAGLYLQAGADIGAFVDKLNRHDFGQALRITETRGVLARSLAVFERTFKVTDVLRLLAVAVAFVGVLSALLALQLERQAELRLYHALGFVRWQRIRLLLYQTLLIGTLAGLAAIPTGLVLAWGLIDIIQLRAFGWTLVYDVQPLMLLQAPLLAISAALLASLYPAWLLGRAEAAAPPQED